MQKVVVVVGLPMQTALLSLRDLATPWLLAQVEIQGQSMAAHRLLIARHAKPMADKAEETEVLVAL